MEYKVLCAKRKAWKMESSWWIAFMELKAGKCFLFISRSIECENTTLMQRYQGEQVLTVVCVWAWKENDGDKWKRDSM